VTATQLKTWTDVCAFTDLTESRGAAALIGDLQIALFRVQDGVVYALSNFDPFSSAYVMSRGIVGSKGDTPKVASPIFKQNFDLRTGECLDDPSVSLASFPVRVVGGRVEVSV